jgi:cobalt-zinc-cadmium efflux system outer membrane protein
MFRWKRFLAVGAGAVLCLQALHPPRDARGQEADVCGEHVTRASVVVCALRASPLILAEQHSLTALDGRRTSASLVLPSNPTLALSVARRWGGLGEPDATDWSATLSQEIEIAGQRGARLDVVDRERVAQRGRVAATQREVASAALSAYFDALAAMEEKQLAERLVALGTALSTLARGRTEAGLATAVDAEIADAAATKLTQTRFAAERRVGATSLALTMLLGQDPTKVRVRAEGELVPLAIVNADVGALANAAIARRAEIAVADAERAVQERRATLFSRSRYPNLTLSVFAQNDRIAERIVGFGVALPIPMPAPIGHTYAGEIAEAHALADRAGAEAQRLRQVVRLEVATAADAVAIRKRELTAFDPERLRRAEEALGAIARELDARRLGVRDALLAQQTLIELLQSYIEARRQLCLASVELARSAGVTVGGGAP